MNSNVSNTNLTSTIYLYDRDRFIYTEGTKGEIALQDDRIIFTPVEGTQLIKIELFEIAEVDFTNIIAKTQFIITSGSSKYVFCFASPYSWKEFLPRLFIPLQGLISLRAISKNEVESQKWKSALVAALPPEVVRQRVEVKATNVIFGSLLVAGILIASLAAFIFLIPR